MEKIKSMVQKVKEVVTMIRIPWLLPRLYIKLFIFGLILVGLNFSYLPNLTYCADMFGGDLCSPIGIYLIALISIPGYLVVNAIFPNAAQGNDSLYSLIVFVTSLLIYSILGYFFSKKKEVKIKSAGIIYLIFLILLFLLLVLITMIRG